MKTAWKILLVSLLVGLILSPLYIGGTRFMPDQAGGLYSLKIAGGKLPTFDQDQNVFSVTSTMEAAGDRCGMASYPDSAQPGQFHGSLPISTKSSCLALVAFNLAIFIR
jgi:hypothetical protein